jgi:hypothetical protein
MSAHCEVETLSAWLDDALEAAEAARVAAHLGRCAECSAELADLRRVVAGLRALERLAPPPALAIEVGRRRALSWRRPGLAVRLAEGRQAIQPSVGLLFALVVAFALIGGLAVLGPQLRQERTLPVRFHDPPETTTAALPAAGTLMEIAGRQLVWDGEAWREAASEGVAGREVRIGSAEWARWLDGEPRLVELETLAAPVLVRDGGELVRVLPAAP